MPIELTKSILQNLKTSIAHKINKHGADKRGHINDDNQISVGSLLLKPDATEQAKVNAQNLLDYIKGEIFTSNSSLEAELSIVKDQMQQASVRGFLAEKEYQLSLSTWLTLTDLALTKCDRELSLTAGITHMAISPKDILSAAANPTENLGEEDLNDPLEKLGAVGGEPLYVNVPQKSPHSYSLETIAFLKSQLKDVKSSLKPIENDPRYLLEDIDKPGLPINRFKDIFCLAKTSLSPTLNANHMVINKQYCSIACQYPLECQLEAYLEKVVELRTPVIVVLAHKSKILQPNFPINQFPSIEQQINQREQMLDYFSQNGVYGKMAVTSKFVNEVQFGDLVVANYILSIKGGDKPINTDVFHVQNWNDMSSVGKDEIKALSGCVMDRTIAWRNTYANLGSRAISDQRKILPFVHCRAGVGRAGLLIAAMAMNKFDNNVSLEKIITDMRHSRNGHMVQTDEQLDTLIALAKEQGRPLIDGDSDDK